MPKNGSVKYDCLKCPGYCCSYPIIEVKPRDISRLAKHFGMSDTAARKKFTKAAHGHDAVLRRKADPHFGRICRFFDTDKRRCTIYKARPETCRSFPGEPKCGYYDFLEFERRHQDDPEYVAITDSEAWK